MEEAPFMASARPRSLYMHTSIHGATALTRKKSSRSCNNDLHDRSPLTDRRGKKVRKPSTKRGSINDLTTALGSDKLSACSSRQWPYGTIMPKCRGEQTIKYWENVLYDWNCIGELHVHQKSEMIGGLIYSLSAFISLKFFDCLRYQRRRRGANGDVVLIRSGLG